MKITLEYVQYMPKEMQPGILYVSKEYSAAAHLCPCGCKSKVRTPLGPTDWHLEETPDGPTLYPSIGNWQQSCKSHYWIQDGVIEWAESWTDEEIEIGRRLQERRNRVYYESRQRKNNVLRKTLITFKHWFNRKRDDHR